MRTDHTRQDLPALGRTSDHMTGSPHTPLADHQPGTRLRRRRPDFGQPIPHTAPTTHPLRHLPSSDGSQPNTSTASSSPASAAAVSQRRASPSSGGSSRVASRSNRAKFLKALQIGGLYEKLRGDLDTGLAPKGTDESIG